MNQHGSIYGIVPPLTTPFTQDGDLREDLLAAEVRYLIEKAGVHGIAVGGSTGEGHTLSADELRQVVGTAVDAAQGRVPVIAGVIVDSTRQALERAAALADLPVAAYQVTPVHYLFRPDDDGLYHYFADIAERVSAPVIIYNVVPWVYCSPDLLVRIITGVDGVLGVKQSAGDLKLMADLLLKLDGKGLVMSAVDALLYPSFVLGAQGAIAAILAAVPERCVQLWDAVQAGDHAQALRLHGQLLTIWNAMVGDNLPANVKTILQLQGREAGFPRGPMPVSSPSRQAALQDALRQTGVLATS